MIKRSRIDSANASSTDFRHPSIEEKDAVQ